MDLVKAKLAVSAIQGAAAIRQHTPYRYDVAFLSRQSQTPSRDFKALYNRMSTELGTDRLILRTCDSELSGKAAFIRNMYEQFNVAMVSKVIVLDGYNPMVSIPSKRAGSRVVQLWHAPGAVKKFGYQAVDTPAGRSAEQAQLFRMHRNYDCIIAAGPGAMEAYSQAFGYDVAHILPLGLPRIDYLLDRDPSGPRLKRDKSLRRRFPFLSDERVNVLYAPTLRKGNRYQGWIERYLDELLTCCVSSRTNVIFAGHPLDHEVSGNLMRRHLHLRLCPGASTIDLLESADLVVTDYSSVALEAGLIGKDVAFFVPDLAEYRRSPGLNIDVADPNICFAAEDAATIMGVLDGPRKKTEAGMNAWKHFCSNYFAGITTGSTERIAACLIDLLRGRHAGA